MLHAAPNSLQRQDAEYRATVVGRDQVGIENEMIQAKNGVFVLFTASNGTPQMISMEGEVPAGLIPGEQLGNYETSVKPRVKTTHLMPQAGVNTIFIHHQDRRVRVDKNEFVDETHYNELLAKHSERFSRNILLKEQFDDFAALGVPAAFYYYLPEGEQSPKFASVFAKQINSTIGNKMSDPGVHINRKQDLDTVNEMLKRLGYLSVEELLTVKDMRRDSKDFNTKFKELKKNSQWSNIIQLGEERLKKDLADSERATIHARLASSYFYLGLNYDQAEFHAQKCYDIGNQIEDPKLKIRGLYLLSATSRVGNHHDLARGYAQKAESIYHAYELINPLLKGKIYFNWGAAEGNDPNGNLDEEKELYLKALGCYKEANSADDILRVVVRLVNNAVSRKDAFFARDILKNVEDNMINRKQRSAGHYFYALAKLCQLEGKDNEAWNNTNIAVGILEALNAHADLNRARNLLLNLRPPHAIGKAYELHVSNEKLREKIKIEAEHSNIKHSPQRTNVI